MNVVISQEHRFERTPDGAIWTQAAFPRSYFSQYLEVFDTARVVARVRDVSAPPAGAKRADGEGVTFHAIPHYVGPEQFLLRWPKIRRAVRSAIQTGDAVILRVQSQIASGMESMLHRSRRPYGLEVMCDPYEMFAPHANDHPLRSIFQLLFYFQMKKQCGRAPAVSYVTQNCLQRRYPPPSIAISTSYSTVELPDDAFVSSPRSFANDKDPVLITVGSLDQPYKGVDSLIDAFRASLESGLKLRLIVIGDGRYRAQLQAQADSLGDRVQFLGQVSSGAGVRAHLDGADLFVLPSRTEGLPRAMIEAMARALPTIGSRVGGIPELLDAQDLTNAGDRRDLSAKIQEVIGSPDRLNAMSRRNLDKSKFYRSALMRSARSNYYRGLKELTEAWHLRAGALARTL